MKSEIIKKSDFFIEFLSDIESNEEIKQTGFNLGYIPFEIKRVDDGELLRLNKNKKTYSFINFRNNCEYTWGRLFMDHRCEDAFSVVSWVKIENIDSKLK